METERRDWNVFKQIFSEHWEDFKERHPRYASSYYDSVVRKMLDCGDPKSMGYQEYRCTDCGVGHRIVPMSCKSSFCLRCCKVYVDDWVETVSRHLHPGVVYRHIVLTVPEMYRLYFYKNVELHTPLFHCGVACLDDFFSTVSRRKLEGGYIVVFQTHGRNGQYNPHLHIIATSGGCDAERGEWKSLSYLPYPMLHKKWQWHLLEMLKRELATEEMHKSVDEGYRRYPNGFVANVQINYRERYKAGSGRDPLVCPSCGKEMILWKIWHPEYGILFDAVEEGQVINECKREERGDRERGRPFRSTSGGVQLSLFGVRA